MQLLDDDFQVVHRGGMVYAGFWQRFLAVIVDSIIVGVPLLIVYLISNGFSLFNRGLSIGIGYSFGSLIAFWVYEAVMISSDRQATFGKELLNIRVTDMSGGQLNFQQASVRYFAKSIVEVVGLVVNTGALYSVISLVSFVGYIMQPFTEKKQALHDIVANTLVVLR